MGKRIESLADLTPDRRNARKRGQRAERVLVASLQEVGAARSIVVDEDGRILAGNGTVQAAAEIGIDRVRVIDADGETIVAVRRTGLTEAQKRRLAILDNRTAELAEWDTEILTELVDDGLDITDLWSPDELDALFANDGAEERGGLLDSVDPDEIPENAPTRCNPGDLWQLGKHRLLCGDCTKAENVERLMNGTTPMLMVTDPPYGVEYDAEWRNHALRTNGSPSDGRAIGKVSNDHRADWSEAWRLFEGDVAYVWHGATKAHIVAQSLIDCGLELVSQIVWAKNNLVIGRGNYHHKHEPCWYAVRKNGKRLFTGDRSQTTLWEINKPHKSETGHSTQKPVECMARAIRNHGMTEVYDPFLGSGTTLIAAEQLGRECYGMEIDPKYCDVILARWEAATGKVAVRI